MTSSGGSVAVRARMTIAEAEQLAEILPRCPAPVKLRVHDQLWLKAIFESAVTRVPVPERERFRDRADRILEALDPQEDDE